MIWFAEYFGSDYTSQRAEIERLASIGSKQRRDAVLKARALKMLVIDPSGKPRPGEPVRLARALNRKVTTVQGWIEDFQGLVKALVKHRCVMTRAQAWNCIKNLHPDAVIERGIQRSTLGQKAGSKPRSRKGREKLRKIGAPKAKAPGGLSRHDCPTCGPERLYDRGLCVGCGHQFIAPRIR